MQRHVKDHSPPTYPMFSLPPSDLGGAYFPISVTPILKSLFVISLTNFSPFLSNNSIQEYHTTSFSTILLKSYPLWDLSAFFPCIFK